MFHLLSVPFTPKHISKHMLFSSKTVNVILCVSAYSGSSTCTHTYMYM